MAQAAQARVLVLEDEATIALDLQASLRTAGYEVVGPVARVDKALHWARSGSIDLAVLDINIGGTPSYDVADALSDRGIPILFVTGYTSTDLPERFRAFRLVRKPFTTRAIMGIIDNLTPSAVRS